MLHILEVVGSSCKGSSVGGPVAEAHHEIRQQEQTGRIGPADVRRAGGTVVEGRRRHGHHLSAETKHTSSHPFESFRYIAHRYHHLESLEERELLGYPQSRLVGHSNHFFKRLE